MTALLSILVKPNAPKDEISIRDGEIFVSVMAVPDKGKANKAIIKLLSKALDIPLNSISITGGLTSRTKSISIDNYSTEQIIELLQKNMDL